MARNIYDDELKQVTTLDQEISEAVFRKEFYEMKQEFKDDLKDQRNLSLQIIIGVVIAFLLTVGLAVVD